MFLHHLLLVINLKNILEFGATDGLEPSNSYMLENSLSWKGVLSEPSPQWHDLLKK